MALLSPLCRQQGTRAVLLRLGLLDVGGNWHICAGDLRLPFQSPQPARLLSPQAQQLSRLVGETPALAFPAGGPQKARPRQRCPRCGSNNVMRGDASPGGSSQQSCSGERFKKKCDDTKLVNLKSEE